MADILYVLSIREFLIYICIVSIVNLLTIQSRHIFLRHIHHQRSQTDTEPSRNLVSRCIQTGDCRNIIIFREYGSGLLTGVREKTKTELFLLILSASSLTCRLGNPLGLSQVLTNNPITLLARIH